ncbi:Cof-type HAD-IIB family hydrolase [Inconstantimicrobium mannanitabidum]|uniref:Hydrolase n=1 Tax=Inconstantimicrobium mannanitabidum TaxID=1604901 RepID=A0ACB5R818_9CLOT|nr:Cof-type HAD-IIB family hydrolase [Clostridium sp. TW13]GKX65171.1 hydrolase [Clostridium sp. TW13]
MKRKAVFFDIDGTLYNPVIGVPDSTIEGIKQLKQNGHLAFISTGRARAMIPQELVDLGFDGVLAACGTYVEYERSVIYNLDLEESICGNVISTLKKHNIFFILEGQDYLYMDDGDDFEGDQFSIKTFKKLFGDKIKPVTGLGLDYRFNKITCKTNEHSNFKEAYKSLEKDFDCICHSAQFIELVPKGFSKVKGIEAILQHLNINIENTYAFGDSLNDIDMLNYVEYGIAMGNSSAEVLKIANYKTDTLENNGIYKGLKQFNLI